MDWLQVIALAIVQGLTEFLPISSSAHLILLPVLTGWTDQGLAFDVAVHVGSLAAVIGYFRAEVVRLIRGGAAPLAGRPAGPDGRLAWLIVLATIPVCIVGLAFADPIETYLRTPTVIAWASIVFGIVLWLADRHGPRVREEGSLGWRGALGVGLAQVLALIPGTSRSGITITAGLAIGLDRRAASRFAFLLAIPVIALSGLYQTAQLITASAPVPWGTLLAATALSGLSAWLCIHLFLRFIERVGMTPFVIYRVALGVVLLAVYGG
ncbi:MAG: undecaprenyl-diphosphate phosphatase [Halofilum sp. (in: g-proteobacteria)]